jgi:hypothetical protein
MADSVVEVKDDQFLTLVVQNHGTGKVHLEKGLPLGTVAQIDVLSRGDGREDSGDLKALGLVHPASSDMEPDSGEQQQMGETPRLNARATDLFSQLDVDFHHLTEQEQASLKTLLVSYADVFALDPSELGTTKLVTHSIN